MVSKLAKSMLEPAGIIKAGKANVWHGDKKPIFAGKREVYGFMLFLAWRRLYFPNLEKEPANYFYSVYNVLQLNTKEQADRILKKIEEELPQKADTLPTLTGKFSGLRKFGAGDFRVIF